MVLVCAHEFSLRSQKRLQFFQLKRILAVLKSHMKSMLLKSTSNYECFSRFQIFWNLFAVSSICRKSGYLLGVVLIITSNNSKVCSGSIDLDPSHCIFWCMEYLYQITVIPFLSSHGEQFPLETGFIAMTELWSVIWTA